jgi:hypothetical protein
LLLMGKGVENFEWAHCYSWEKVSTTLNGPIGAHEKAAEDVDWAHSYSWGKVSTTLNEPIVSHEKLPMT